MSSLSNKSIVTTSFLTGFAVASFFRLLDKRRESKKNHLNAGAGPKNSDASMFWGDVQSLTEIPQKRKFLPADLYSQMVLDCVVCCVDCLVVRFNPLMKRKECLLVERASEPAKGIWWLPGGRLFKGETFFDGAVRKAREETGLVDVEPVQILGFYNTFFPTSAWDTGKCSSKHIIALTKYLDSTHHIFNFNLNKIRRREPRLFSPSSW